MSGHSKWSTIKRQKGATDAKRGNLFTKLGNSIAIAVHEGGGGDPDSNFKLRLVIEKARQANMPKENIQRSIDRGLGKGEAAALQSAIFEGFAPGGAAIIVETITDNTTRTGAELRNVFEKNGGHLASPGAVAYMFSRVGEIELAKTAHFDEVFEKAAAAGAEDVEETEDLFLVYTRPEDLHRVAQKLGGQGRMIYRPNKESIVTLPDTTKLENFVSVLHDLDDVQEVYVNV
ncbi:YebC/PmpR family DNA-binding transcriptional regulator [Candidatus Microgenomates bacterium]|nr:YebC/PmpR family DNA-binding transcriptional regulator [Candidatus Microgenomates bacterium]